MIPEELPFNPDMLDRTIPDDIGAGPGGRLEGMETHEVRRANTGAAGPPITIQVMFPLTHVSQPGKLESR